MRRGRLVVRGLDKAVENSMDKLGSMLETEIKKVIREKNLIFTGELVESIERYWEKPKSVYVVEVGAPHSGILEWGASSVDPDWELLYDWVVKKKGEDELIAPIVTDKVAYKLRTKGLEPRRFVKEALKRFIRKYGEGMMVRVVA